MSLLIPSPCSACECCVQFMFYSYANNPAYGNPTCEGCCGASISGNLYSETYSQSCFDLLKPKAIIRGGSRIDNIGEVANIVFTPVPVGDGVLSFLLKDTEVTPTRVGNKLSLPFFARNDSTCGPYGLLGVSIKWFFN